ncbi:MAG: diguanylate cyclase [Acidobacteriota bacterium]|nr:diguanylate cyclase [Acidobacteriota bacterium]
MSHEVAPNPRIDADYRLHALRTAIWPGLFGCAICAAYYLWTWGDAHRTPLLLICGSCALLLILTMVLPMRRIMNSAAREPFLVCWGAAIIVIVAGASALDGGVNSPIVVLFFLPLVGAALTYSIATMVAAGALDVVGYLALVPLSSHAWGPRVFMFAAGLIAATWICVWQAIIREHQRHELDHLSRTDMLTGVLNRRGFEERFRAELSRARREGAQVSLALLDLDGLKTLNDTRGHPAGDELLHFVGQTMIEELRGSDAVGRMGGDEFAILFPGVGSELRAVVERLRERLSVRTGAGAGIASFPDHGSTLDELMRHADLALYQSKATRPREAASVEGGPQPADRGLEWAAALAAAVDERLGEAHSHAQAVSNYAIGIGSALGWDGAGLGLLRLAAALHDVGKSEVDDQIVCKPGPLTDAEWDAMRRHAAAGARLVACVDGLDAIAPWIRHAHERVDGTGYPDRLEGEQIPLASRIILVADAYDAMRSDRPYRPGMTHDQAVTELRRNAGASFDRRCVEALLDFLDDSGAGRGSAASATGAGGAPGDTGAGDTGPRDATTDDARLNGRQDGSAHGGGASANGTRERPRPASDGPR